MSKASDSGYQIRALEKQIAQAAKEKDKLEVAIIEQSSLAALNKRMQELQMVPVQKMAQFMVEGAAAVAMKQP
jgi:Asp/Glu/hydantoin racemase